MKEKRRLFLALPIPVELKEEILRRRSEVELSFKWIPAENLHVTVLFLGSVPEEKLQIIVDQTELAVRGYTPFELKLKGLKIQKGKFQEMIWVNFHRSEEFETLSKNLSLRLDYKVKQKPLPHINLVRSKEKIVSANLPLNFRDNLFLKVNTVELWESHLNPKGATYSRLRSFPLKN